MSSRYRIASPFSIRLAGAPFNVLERLGTPALAGAARELLAREGELARIKPIAEEFIRRRDNGLAPREFHVWRTAIRRGGVPQDEEIRTPAELRSYAMGAQAFTTAHSQFATELQAGVTASRAALLSASAELLPAYLVFASQDAHQLMDLTRSGEPLPTHNSGARKRDRHLLLYLQRIASKNDTFSEFGPSVWGRVNTQGPALKLDTAAGVTRREAFPERWVAHALAAAMNTDPEIAPELRPRLNPNGSLQDDRFVFSDTGESVQIKPEQQTIICRCDGKTPLRDIATSSDDATEALRQLIEAKVLIAAVEVPAMEPFACEILHRDVKRWSEGPTKQRWLSMVAAFSAFAAEFARTIEPPARAKILDEARRQLSTIGIQPKQGQRALYAATNPIAEECTRDCTFEMTQALLDEVVNEAEPWIDFWRDSYAFVAARVAANLRSLLEKAAAKNRAMPLPAFLRFCESAKLPLTGPGLVGMAHIAFQEVKNAFRERLCPHAGAAEYELTPEDCAVVRKNFDYPKFDQFTYPSADLQLAAKSVEAVNRGEYRWLIAELHPAVAALHHGVFWSCPDREAFSRALESMIHDKPVCHFGFFAADFTAHTTVRLFDALPKHAVFASAQRAHPDWRYVAPCEVEVFVDEEGDVALRRGAEYLGSLARNWVIPLGFHPFLFTIAPNTPRLRCGRVVVQRRAWSVSAEELGAGDFSGVSRDLVLAVEKLRAAKDWPRFIYIRPSEQALRRSGAENRDKDTKPVFIDLESYLFLEIFHRWLTKAGELEVTEMFPAPDQLLWQEDDGRRTFEMRTLICPR
ncbi:MAG: lantibiotic dehydratase [Chthoniobacterales bacterium]